MSKQSAGLLVYRFVKGQAEVLLVHPGGPYWAKKDQHAWSIPKGEVEADEDKLAAAKREFKEELGLDPPEGELQELGEVKASGGKVNHIWAVSGDLDVRHIASNLTETEWPPRSDRKIQIPEVDKAAWVPLHRAQWKLHKGQAAFIDRLAAVLNLNMDIEENAADATRQQSLF